MLSTTFARSTRTIRPGFRTPTLFLRGASRPISTLPDNPHIYAHPHPTTPSSTLLSVLPTTPPNPRLAIGTCTSLPPTPQNFTPNPDFLRILSSVYAQHATSDPDVQQQASAYASPGGSNLSHPSDGAGGANHQGGMGGAGHGGWVHVSDLRNPPDYGRIAWPEDIIGSVEVNSEGRFDGRGGWQDSGTYRIITREGILGLTDFMMGRVVERLRGMEKEEETKAGQ